MAAKDAEIDDLEVDEDDAGEGALADEDGLSGGVRMEGELRKLGGGAGGRKGWSKRWFVLKDNLAYYKSEADFQAGTAPKGIVMLNAYFVARTDKRDKFEFTVHAYPKPLTCQSVSEEAMNEWINVLNAPLKEFMAGPES
tara:strand:- start:2059 stop:2478 length:420 start_codon:yes stop_codon:yes gene_type:complete